MQAGEVGILNVGAGDIRISFDKNNPAEVIRSRRVVSDMLRRGYALLVEVERNGEKKFERAIAFDENTDSYIVADFDPIAEEDRDAMRSAEVEAGWNQEKKRGESQQTEAAASEESSREDGNRPSVKPGAGRRGRPRKSVPAGSTRAVAVGGSAGG